MERHPLGRSSGQPASCSTAAMRSGTKGVEVTEISWRPTGSDFSPSRSVNGSSMTPVTDEHLSRLSCTNTIDRKYGRNVPMGCNARASWSQGCPVICSSTVVVSSAERKMLSNCRRTTLAVTNASLLACRVASINTKGATTSNGTIAPASTIRQCQIRRRRDLNWVTLLTFRMT